MQRQMKGDFAGIRNEINSSWLYMSEQNGKETGEDNQVADVKIAHERLEEDRIPKRMWKELNKKTHFRIISCYSQTRLANLLIGATVCFDTTLSDFISSTVLSISVESMQWSDRIRLCPSSLTSMWPSRASKIFT